MPEFQAVGIDLGTTYSAVARIDERGRSVMVRNAENEMLTPSVVLFDAGEVVVGREAKKAAGERSESVALCVKRDMGKPVYSRPINGQNLPPEVIQAYILKKLKADIDDVIDAPWKTVITVPAYFDEPRRKATADAGEMAGLEVLDIVNEPTAAALAFGEALGYLTKDGTAKQPLKVLVYDLGGGTFDVTLIELQPGDLRTLATDGDVQLGGRDWDGRLVDHAAAEFYKRYGYDPRTDANSEAQLLRSAEDAKHTLSVRDHATIHARAGSFALEVPITRAQFDDLTADLVERTSHTTREVLSAVNHTWDQIDRVLLVGGSTRMPMITQMIRELSGKTPDRAVHPDEAVARGAAIFAGYLMSTRGHSPAPAKFSVTDVNSHSLGIEGIDQATGRRENNFVIPRNTPLPHKKVKKCMTKKANQQSVVVQVLEGESRLPMQCWPIGRAVMKNLPPGLPDASPINVTYEYASNGRLQVMARLEATGREVSIDLEREGGLTNQVIGRWKQILREAKGFDAFESMLEGVLGMAPAVSGAATPQASTTQTKSPRPATSTATATAPPAARPTAPTQTSPVAQAPAAEPQRKSILPSAASLFEEELPLEKPAMPTKTTTTNRSFATSSPAAARASAVLAPAAQAAAADPWAAGNPLQSSPGQQMLVGLLYALIALVFLTAGYYLMALTTPIGNALDLPLPGLPPATPPGTTVEGSG